MIEEAHVWLQRKSSMSEEEQLAHCLLVRTELVFERNTSCKSEFSMWRKAHFVPLRNIQVCRRNTYISPKKPLMLEVAACSTLFPCEN
jgi:hypothetical protein